MKNMFKMAILDQNCSLLKVNFGRFFTDLKIARKIAQSGHPGLLPKQLTNLSAAFKAADKKNV
jgi:hypothetical protein